MTVLGLGTVAIRHRKMPLADCYKNMMESIFVVFELPAVGPPGQSKRTARRCTLLVSWTQPQWWLGCQVRGFARRLEVGPCHPTFLCRCEFNLVSRAAPDVLLELDAESACWLAVDILRPVPRHRLPLYVPRHVGNLNCDEKVRSLSVCECDAQVMPSRFL